MAHMLVHRGLGNKRLVENTIQAFSYCFKKKYGIETDLQVTKDNKIICFHDFTLKKFKINKNISDLSLKEIQSVGKKFKFEIPEINKLIKISKNRHYIMLELKSLFSKKSILKLLKLTKKHRNFCITSFKEENIKNIYKIRKNLKLGLLFASTSKPEKIIKKSKNPYVKLLVMEKKFLDNRKLLNIKKPIYFYTARSKLLRKKYKDRNLIFEYI